METYLAIAVIASWVFAFLPGSIYRDKPEINWSVPNPYIAILGSVAGLVLAILVIWS